MARLHSVGFELAGTVAASPTGYEIGDPSADVTPLSIQTTTKRSGSYALRCGGSGQPLVTVTPAYTRVRFVSTSAAGPFFVRAYVYFATFPSAENRFLGLMVAGGATTPVRISIDNTGTLFLRDEDGLIGSAASPLSTGVWYRLELEYDGSGLAGTNVVRLYVDGSEVVGSATRAVGALMNAWGMGGNMASEANTTGEWYFDDVAINNNAGSVQNTLPGAGKIVHCWPDGDGDADTLVTRSSGATTPTGTDRGANWQQLGAAFDKPSPNDATDFLLLTATTSEVLVACESSATAGIGASDTVTLVQVGGRIRGVSTSAGNWIPRVMSQSAGTKVAGDTVAIASTTFNSHDDTLGDQQYKLTCYVDPQAGGAWTPALIDSMQIGGATTDGNPDTLITLLWALVEYVPVVAAPFLAREPFLINQTVNRAGTY
jgi:hypothetical protein